MRHQHHHGGQLLAQHAIAGCGDPMDDGIVEAGAAGLIEHVPGWDLINKAALFGVHRVAVELGLHQQLRFGGHIGGGTGPVAGLHDRVEAVVREGKGGEQDATGPKDAGNFFQG
ncbi:MAG: hypothetical protein ACK56I_00975, partial [bacterium]